VTVRQLSHRAVVVSLPGIDKAENGHDKFGDGVDDPGHGIRLI
jgi:hypothetical protein